MVYTSNTSNYHNDTINKQLTFEHLLYIILCLKLHIVFLH